MDVGNLQLCYQKFGWHLPKALSSVVVRELLISKSNSGDKGLAPWVLCEEPVIMPLSKLWPETLSKTALFPFAHRLDQDDIACFVLPLIGDDPAVAVIHWQIGSKTTYLVEEEFATFWEWFHSAIDDVKFLAEI